MSKKNKAEVSVTKLIKGREFMKQLVLQEKSKLTWNNFDGSYEQYLKQHRAYEQELLDLDNDIKKFQALRELSNLTDKEIKEREKKSVYTHVGGCYVNF